MSRRDPVLLEVVRETLNRLDAATPATASRAIEPLLVLGITAGCGRTEVVTSYPDDSQEALRWFAGEIVDVVQSESWFAVNSLINCRDRWTT